MWAGESDPFIDRTEYSDGLFNISYCFYNQSEKLENNYKTSFWKSQHFFSEKHEDPTPPVCFCSLFNDPSPPPSSPQRMYFLNNPFWNLCSWQSNSSGENETALSLLHKWFGSYWEHLLLRQCNKDHLDFCKNNPKL